MYVYMYTVKQLPAKHHNQKTRTYETNNIHL